MKVLKSGNPKGTWNQQITCNGHGNGNAGCGAVLEVTAEDLFHTKFSFCGRFEEDLITIECPECKAWTDFTAGQRASVPSGVTREVMKLGLSTTGKSPVRS